MNGARIVRMIAAAAMSLVATLAGAAPGTVACTVASSGIALGIYNPVRSAPTTGTGVAQIDCRLTSGRFARVAVTLSLSAGNSNNFTGRRMLSGSNFLGYGIYWDAAYSQIAGDGTGGSTADGPFAAFLNRRNSTYSRAVTMYGQIPALQDVAPGTYVDTIVATVTY